MRRENGPGRRIFRCLLVVLGLAAATLFFVPASPVQADSPKVLVAAAANLRPVLGELAAAFSRRGLPCRIEPVFGASGILCTEILEGASFDLFLSADRSYPQRLAEKGLGRPNQVFIYAYGQLALWVGKWTGVSMGRPEEVLLDRRIGRIALANPSHAPYGCAALVALDQAGLTEKIRDKLVYAEDVTGAMSLALSRAVEAALVPLSVAREARREGWYTVWSAAGIPRVEQGGIILSGSVCARAFRDFLLSSEGQAILERHGYLRVKETKRGA
ncbi:molybdate ABC transporter substrate-binding protein [Candidatus Methylacidithermus pantelleriae]|uniref:Putative Molybdate transport system substrate-binding protein n=1 Tax=Candidatus Methylacidithermus pantelleriae TaxID=2744239 RepID=A0A8J2BM38_9BACT|nr:molybdate ABC transporter substrate-binding protein [Candidatus Methylacidithermus pantelleriae]CAF0689381.1 putative Molybdate transport system substrate-binding protein [Candidatus Methylacidithermus pantelleriae]